MSCVFDGNVVGHGYTLVNGCFVESKPVAQEVDGGFCGQFSVNVWNEVCIAMYCQHIATLIVQVTDTEVSADAEIVVFLFLGGSMDKVIMVIPCDAYLAPNFINAVAGPQLARLVVVGRGFRREVLLV
jgi:hypothetical protein